METGNKWFKFYGQDWLTDLKIMRLTIEDRLCYITLLCLASSSSDQGIIRNCDEEAILQLTHLYNDPYDDNNEYSRAKGCLKRFEEKGMVTISGDNDVTINAFNKRQQSYLTGAERAKKYRENKPSSDERHTNNVTKVTLEKNRIEKNREEKREEASLDFLKKVPETVIEEFRVQFQCSPDQIRKTAASLFDYCEAHGKRYKDYKAMLRNALRRDFGELSEEDKRKNAELKERVLNLKRKMTL